MCVSFALFTLEIILNSVVDDDFKYSFFFWLDIIATLSLIPDIDWISSPLAELLGSDTISETVDVLPGKLVIYNETAKQMTKVIKSLRLIRMIRIIKLYKYVSKSSDGKSKDDDKKSKKLNRKESLNTENS